VPMRKAKTTPWWQGLIVVAALGWVSVRGAVGQNPVVPPAPTPTPAATPAPTPGITFATIPDDLRDDPSLSREERIRRHQIRLQKFLDEANVRAEAQQKEMASQQQQAIDQQKAMATGAANPSGKPGGPPGTMVPPGAMAGPPGAMVGAPRPLLPPGAPPGAMPSSSGAGQAIFRVSEGIVYFQPFQVLTRTGDDFKTDVLVFNSSGKAFDELELGLKYDPLVVVPEEVNDAPIYRLVQGSELQVNRSKGEIRYSAKLRSGILQTTATLLTLRWRALNPVLYSELGFLAGKGGTRIGKGGGNILGFYAAGERTGGTLPAFLVVAPRDNSPRKLIPPLSETALARIDERVELHLEAASETVAKGEEWVVGLMLRNDAGLPFNDLHARILFDPNKLQVVDWHQGNWIREGINIWDGFAHAAYPFDVFESNLANNETGEIRYHVGSQLARYYPSGEFARIKFKALANASLNDVWFDFQDPARSGGATLTDVSFLGSSVMFAPRRAAEAEQRPEPEPLRRPGT